MKVVIIEDEAPAFRRLEKILLEIDPSIEIMEVLDSVEESVVWFSKNLPPDLVFMDIQISDGISFQIFEKTEIRCPVIFTTAFDEYMLKAFKVNSIDYLLKPIKKEELEQSLEKYRKMRDSFSYEKIDIVSLVRQISLVDRNYKTRFLVKQGEKMLSIRTEDITCFHSKHSVVHIHTKSGKTYLADFTLEEVSNQLDPQLFYRANRQFIIHSECIESVHKHFKGKLLVSLNHFAAEQILVSAEKAAAFKQWLDQ